MAGLENFKDIWSVAPETVAIENGKTLAFPTSADTGPGRCLYHAFGERMKGRPKLAPVNIFAMPATAIDCLNHPGPSRILDFPSVRRSGVMMELPVEGERRLAGPAVDIVFYEGDIHGNGVNIAKRLATPALLGEEPNEQKSWSSGEIAAETAKHENGQVIEKNGASDGARTRDLRRDRPAL